MNDIPIPDTLIEMYTRIVGDDVPGGNGAAVRDFPQLIGHDAPQLDGDGIAWKGISNAAVNVVGLLDINGVHLLYELTDDRLVEQYDQAMGMAKVIKHDSSKEWVFVNTGDSILGDPDNSDNDVHDLLFRLIVVPRDVFEGVHNKLLAADKKWRTDVYDRINGIVHDDSHEFLMYEFEYVPLEERLNEIISTLHI